MNNTKDFQPAIHRKLIRKKLMTPQESERIVREWKLKNQIKQTTGETIEDMGVEEEMQDFLDAQEAKGQVHWENTREDIMDEEEGEWLEMHGFPGERGWEI